MQARMILLCLVIRKIKFDYQAIVETSILLLLMIRIMKMNRGFRVKLCSMLADFDTITILFHFEIIHRTKQN